MLLNGVTHNGGGRLLQAHSHFIKTVILLRFYRHQQVAGFQFYDMAMADYRKQLGFQRAKNLYFCKLLTSFYYPHQRLAGTVAFALLVLLTGRMVATVRLQLTGWVTRFLGIG